MGGVGRELDGHVRSKLLVWADQGLNGTRYDKVILTIAPTGPSPSHHCTTAEARLSVAQRKEGLATVN